MKKVSDEKNMNEEKITMDESEENKNLTDQIKAEVKNAMTDAFTNMSKSLKRSMRSRKQTDEDKRKCIRYGLSSPEISQTLYAIVRILHEERFFSPVENPVQTTGNKVNKYYISPDNKTIYNKNFIPFLIFGENGLVTISSIYLTGFCTAILKTTQSYLPAKYIYQLFAIDEKDSIITKAESVFALSKHMKGVRKLNETEEDVEYIHPSFKEHYYDLVRKMWSCVPETFPANKLPSIPIIIRDVLKRRCDMKDDLSDSDSQFISQHEDLRKEMEECVKLHDISSDFIQVIRDILSELEEFEAATKDEE